jgi:D-inositol-3-phosphate glycosyltransferase
MSLPQIVHLLDDASAGGITRFVSHLTRSSGLARSATHRIETVSKRRIGAPAYAADVIVSHLAISWRSLPALMALRARNPGARILHVEHTYTEGFAEENVPAQGRFETLLRTAYSLFDHVVAVSAGQADWMRRRSLVAASALRVIPPAVDVSQFLALEPCLTAPRRFLAIGRLHRQKGFDTLIHAFRRLEAPNLRLSIVGAGEERTALAALATGDARITLTGQMGDPLAAMAAADAIVMPSRWEAFGIVGLEARAAGRMLLAASVDGLQDHIRAGATGVADNTVGGWARALRAASDPGATAALMVSRARTDAAATEARLVTGWSVLFDTVAHHHREGLVA